MTMYSQHEWSSEMYSQFLHLLLSFLQPYHTLIRFRMQQIIIYTTYSQACPSFLFCLPNGSGFTTHTVSMLIYGIPSSPNPKLVYFTT